MSKMPNEPKKLIGGGLFQDFEWIPDSYDNCIYEFIPIYFF